MTSRIFEFGQTLPGYDVPVLNEGDVRADAYADAERCKVPEFAKAMGHEAIWKQHNGCQ